MRKHAVDILKQARLAMQSNLGCCEEGPADIVLLNQSLDKTVWIDAQPGLFCSFTLLHSERPKLHRVLAVLSAIGLKQNWFSNAQAKL